MRMKSSEVVCKVFQGFVRIILFLRSVVQQKVPDRAAITLTPPRSEVNFTGSSDVYALPHELQILFGSTASIHERNITSIFESKYTRINTAELQRLNFRFESELSIKFLRKSWRIYRGWLPWLHKRQVLRPTLILSPGVCWLQFLVRGETSYSNWVRGETSYSRGRNQLLQSCVMQNPAFLRLEASVVAFLQQQQWCKCILIFTSLCYDLVSL